jgi:hypothetical protein
MSRPRPVRLVSALPWQACAVLALTVALLASGCKSSPTEPDDDDENNPPPTRLVLTGDWERINSSFSSLDGMVVRVNSSETQALIVSTPANPFQFAPNDLKWRNVVRVSDTRFSFEDLVRESGTGAMSYVAGFIDSRANHTELNMTFPTTGTVQQWKKR